MYDPSWHIKEEGQELIDRERDEKGSFIVQQEFLRPVNRREAYLADVTYGTNAEFGFDYLRDNLAYQIAGRVQREHPFAIIDECDSILIDEARTPLIISAPDEKSSEYYRTFARVVAKLQPEEDYTVDEKLRSVAVTDTGIEKVEKTVGVANLYAPQNLRLVHYLEESLKAKALFQRDKDYVVKQGEIVIVDEFTGRLLAGRRYNGGLHQAIEAKEGVAVKEESRTYAKISIQNYFRLYRKISGMTGTAQTSAEEFHKVYNLEVYTIPTHRQNIRKDNPDVIYKNLDAKLAAIARDVKERHKAGQPVLIGTTSIVKNELISARLSKEGVPHEVLNAKNNEREGAIIAQAGRMGAVTVATNMAGRGVDIILGGNPPDEEEAKKIRELGGLFVVGTERHDARRIDNQLRGRSGRQGDAGESQFYLSLEDDLMRIFGGDRIKTFVERFNMPDDEPIQVGFVSKAVAEAQSKVEGANFDMRKHLLEYDDVLNRQRTAVYAKRKGILESMDAATLSALIAESAMKHLAAMIKARSFSVAELEDPEAATASHLKKQLVESGLFANESEAPKEIESEEEIREHIEQRSSEAAKDPQTILRLLSILDLLWMNHLDDLEGLQESIGLRAYGQKEPLVEYRREASNLFHRFWDNFDGWVFSNIFRLSQASHVHASGKIIEKQPSVAVQSAPPSRAPSESRHSEASRLPEATVAKRDHDEKTVVNIVRAPEHSVTTTSVLPHHAEAVAITRSEPVRKSAPEPERKSAPEPEAEKPATSPAPDLASRTVPDRREPRDPEDKSGQVFGGHTRDTEVADREVATPVSNRRLNPVDYIGHSADRTLTRAKVGRNDPCPCGSGRKWKHCGLINSEEHRARAQK
jgi:preprotein translocase subunit SecA